MAAKPNQTGKEPKNKREYSTFRVYAEHGDLLNELADAGNCSIAEAVERYLDGPIREVLRKIFAEKVKRFS